MVVLLRIVLEMVLVVVEMVVLVVVEMLVLVVVELNGRPEAPWRLAPPLTRVEPEVVTQFQKRN